MMPHRVMLVPVQGEDSSSLVNAWRLQGFEIVNLGSWDNLPVGGQEKIWLASLVPPTDFDAHALWELHLAAGKGASIGVHFQQSGKRGDCILLPDARLVLPKAGEEDKAPWRISGLALVPMASIPSLLEEPDWDAMMLRLLHSYEISGLPLPTEHGMGRPVLDRDWTLFLDRDGVINERIPGDYIRRPSAFHFLPGVLEALQVFREMFGRIVVVTNQQGIGKGWMSEDDLQAVHGHMVDALWAKGVRLDGIYHCPGLAKDLPLCRKPLPGMALQAMADHPEIRLSRSVMVGDSLSDIQFGRRLGLFTVKIGEATGLEHQRVDGLLELAELWKGQGKVYH